MWRGKRSTNDDGGLDFAVSRGAVDAGAAVVAVATGDLGRLHEEHSVDVGAVALLDGRRLGQGGERGEDSDDGDEVKGDHWRQAITRSSSGSRRLASRREQVFIRLRPLGVAAGKSYIS